MTTSLEDIHTNVSENFDQVRPYIGCFVERDTFEAVKTWQLARLTRRSRDLRLRARELALRHGRLFRFVEAVCDEETLRERLRARRKGLSVSDATEDLLDQVRREFDPITELASGRRSQWRRKSRRRVWASDEAETLSKEIVSRSVWKTRTRSPVAEILTSA